MKDEGEQGEWLHRIGWLPLIDWENDCVVVSLIKCCFWLLVVIGICILAQVLLAVMYPFSERLSEEELDEVLRGLLLDNPE